MYITRKSMMTKMASQEESQNQRKNVHSINNNNNNNNNNKYSRVFIHILNG